MSGYTPSPWSIRVQRSEGGQPLSIWYGSKEIATGISGIEDARIIEAAPLLFEFARALCSVVLPNAEHLRTAVNPTEVLSVCRAMLPVIERARKGVD